MYCMLFGMMIAELSFYTRTVAECIARLAHIYADIKILVLNVFALTPFQPLKHFDWTL